MTIQLTSTQRQVLDHAVDQPDGRISWFPAGVKGGAVKKVIDGLFNRALITGNGNGDWFVAAEGYDALGRAKPSVASVTPAVEVEAAVAPAKAAEVPEQPAATPAASVSVDGNRRTRDNTKQAVVLAMLRRPEGATIPQICAATQWQAHTIRGLFAGGIKKKLGLNLISEKIEGDRRYRIA